MGVEKLLRAMRIIRTWADFDVINAENTDTPIALNPRGVRDLIDNSMGEYKHQSPGEGWISVRERVPDPGVVALRYSRTRGRGESVYAHYSIGVVVYEDHNDVDGLALCDYWMPLIPPVSPKKPSPA